MLIRLYINRLLCRIFGHRHRMRFQRYGLYFCQSSGGFDDVCSRCDYRSDQTKRGQETLARNKHKDFRQEKSFEYWESFYDGKTQLEVEMEENKRRKEN